MERTFQLSDSTLNKMLDSVFGSGPMSPVGAYADAKPQNKSMMSSTGGFPAGEGVFGMKSMGGHAQGFKSAMAATWNTGTSWKLAKLEKHKGKPAKHLVNMCHSRHAARERIRNDDSLAMGVNFGKFQDHSLSRSSPSGFYHPESVYNLDEPMSGFEKHHGSTRTRNKPGVYTMYPNKTNFIYPPRVSTPAWRRAANVVAKKCRETAHRKMLTDEADEGELPIERALRAQRLNEDEHYKQELLKDMKYDARINKAHWIRVYESVLYEGWREHGPQSRKLCEDKRQAELAEKRKQEQERLRSSKSFLGALEALSPMGVTKTRSMDSRKFSSLADSLMKKNRSHSQADVLMSGHSVGPIVIKNAN